MSRPHSVGKNLTANTLTTMFTVPTRNMAKWTLLYAYNGTSSAKNFLRIDGQAYVLLDEGDEIRVQSETGSTTTCIITVEIEQRSTVQQFN